MPPGNTTAIEVSHLGVCYGDFRAVDNLSFHVDRGEIFGFLGPNGAGKSTTIKVLMGLLDADQGHVTLLAAGNARRDAEIRRRIGFSAGRS